VFSGYGELRGPLSPEFLASKFTVSLIWVSWLSLSIMLFRFSLYRGVFTGFVLKVSVIVDAKEGTIQVEGASGDLPLIVAPFSRFHCGRI